MPHHSTCHEPDKEIFSLQETKELRGVPNGFDGSKEASVKLRIISRVQLTNRELRKYLAI